MSSFINKYLLLLSFIILTSCTCSTPLKITPIQRSDKKLTCKDVILEINEAEHYRSQASKSQGIGFGEALMPVCWLSGYISGDKAIKAADARINYLGHIYDLMDCGGSAKSQKPVPRPMVIPIAPVLPRSFNKQKKSNNHYKESNGSKNNNKLHEHRDNREKIYLHSHPHKGAHRHFEDE